MMSPSFTLFCFHCISLNCLAIVPRISHSGISNWQFTSKRKMYKSMMNDDRPSTPRQRSLETQRDTDFRLTPETQLTPFGSLTVFLLFPLSLSLSYTWVPGSLSEFFCLTKTADVPGELGPHLHSFEVFQSSWAEHAGAHREGKGNQKANDRQVTRI